MPLPVRTLGALVTAGALLVTGVLFALRPQAPPTPPALPPPPPPAASSAPTARPSATASPAELAVVAPLTPGSELQGFTIREIRGVEQGRMRVVCAKSKDVVVRLEVALDGGEGAQPPATAGSYAIFYSLRGASPEDGELLAKALAAVIGRSKAPPPPGMTPFSPGPKPPTPL